MIRFSLFVAFLFLLSGCSTMPQTSSSDSSASVSEAGEAQGWITMAGATEWEKPIVLHFRRELEFAAPPSRFPVSVTADNRFILYVNGTRVASGPSTASPDYWREEDIDLAPYMRSGHNVIAALVWDSAEPNMLPPTASQKEQEAAILDSLINSLAPIFQTTVGTGFRLVGEGEAKAISTGLPGWRVQRDQGRSFGVGMRQVPPYYYYAAGNPEILDAGKYNFDAAGPVETGEGWTDAVPAPAATERTLTKDPLLEQRYSQVSPGSVVRTDLPAAKGFPASPVTIPAHSKVKFLLRRDTMIAGYPEIDVSGGAGATIKVKWAEALFDDKRKKGDRDLVEDRQPVGIFDTFIVDGKDRTLSLLWWRVWRYAEFEIETGDEPLTLKDYRVFETGYPFETTGKFISDDEELNRIFDIGWRTVQVDAHETYMDTAYWEQHQYLGDTRLQMLISYVMSGDARLGKQVLDAFAASEIAPGLMLGAWPSREVRVIPPFNLLWISVLDDWRMYQDDPAPVRENIPLMRRNLAWWKDYYTPGGLVKKNQYWNFIDWVGQPVYDDKIFPSYDQNNESCLLSVMLAGALDRAALIETDFGDKAQANDNKKWSSSLKQTIRDRCWIETAGMFADNPSGDRFSQHMNALAILYDVVEPEQAGELAARIIAPQSDDKGAPKLAQASYYFKWYLTSALAHVGKDELYFDLLEPWREMLDLNLTTWPEEPGNVTRSDTHAWSGHPTLTLLTTVAGIAPAQSGYRSVRVAPMLGPLKSLQATSATPHGPVSVQYRIQDGVLHAQIARPKALPGVFVWQGKSYPLKSTTSQFDLPVGAEAE